MSRMSSGPHCEYWTITIFIYYYYIFDEYSFNAVYIFQDFENEICHEQELVNTLQGMVVVVDEMTLEGGEDNNVPFVAIFIVRAVVVVIFIFSFVQ